MDYEIGFHADTCCGSRPHHYRHRATAAAAAADVYSGSDDDDDDDDTPLPLPYQAVPRLRAYELPNSPYAAVYIADESCAKVTHWMDDLATIADSDLMAAAAPYVRLHVPVDVCAATAIRAAYMKVPRLENGVYVLIGEENYDVMRTSMLSPRVSVVQRFVDGRRWGIARSPLELADYAYALGIVLGVLHFQLGYDAAEFSVVGCTSAHAAPLMYVQCDVERMSKFPLDNDPVPHAEIVDRFAFALGRLAYVPRPRQDVLYGAFAAGYQRSADATQRPAYAEAVLNAMRVYAE